MGHSNGADTRKIRQSVRQSQADFEAKYYDKVDFYAIDLDVKTKRNKRRNRIRKTSFVEEAKMGK